MSKALKYAVIISGAVVLFDLIIAIGANSLDLTGVCVLSAGFVALAFLLYIVFEIGGIFWKGGNKVLKWINDEPESTKTSAPSQYDEIEGMILYEKDDEHRTYFWNDLPIVLGTAEYFLMNDIKIPYDGLLIVKEEDFTLFKRVDDIYISEREIKRAVRDCVERGNCDVIMAWKGSKEAACARGHYFLYSYSVDYPGLIFDNAGFVHLFDSDCKEFVKSKEKMFEFINKNINRSDIALILSLPAYTILSLSEKVARRSIEIPRSIFIVMFPEEKISYIYDIPFKIRSKKELIRLANEAQRLHTEEAVSMVYSNRTITVAKASFARLLFPNSKESDLNTDIIALFTEDEDLERMEPVKWRAWTKEEIIKEAKEAFGIV